MGIIFPLVIPTVCQLSNCNEDAVVQSSAAILASSLFGNGKYIPLHYKHLSNKDSSPLLSFDNNYVYLLYLIVLVISPIAGICILTVVASQCPLVNQIKSAAVSEFRGVA